MWDYIKKWFGRKALYPIVFAIIVALNNSVLGGLLTEDQLIYLAGVIIAFIIGESAVDFARARKS